MKYNTLIILSIGFQLLTLAGCSKETQNPPAPLTCSTNYSTHAKNNDYLKALNMYVATNRAPGSVIGVKKFGQQEWIGASGFSNLEYNTQMQTCTQFRCGSITKMFTAVIIMQLYDEGKIDLTSTITSLLPELKDQIPDAESMTVKMLLNHSSGLKQPTDDDLNYQLSILNNPDFIGSMSFQKRLENYVYNKSLKHTPGTESYYSNAGYWILGLIIERVTGKTIYELVSDRITTPLNMSNTYLEKRIDDNVSRGYNYSGNYLKDVTIWDRSDSDGDPSAGLISNAHDLLIFAEALFKGTLVSSNALALMKQTTVFSSCGGDCGYGLGIENWKTVENFGYGKNGTSIGVDANLIFFPDKETTIVIFSNFGGGNDKSVIDLLLEI